MYLSDAGQKVIGGRRERSKEEKAKVGVVNTRHCYVTGPLF